MRGNHSNRTMNTLASHFNVIAIPHWMASLTHYNDVTMSTMASQITSLTIVYSTVYSGAHQRKYQSSESLAFVWGIHRWPVNSPYKGPVTQKMFPLDDVIMECLTSYTYIFSLYVSIDLVHLSTPYCIPIVQPVKTNKHGYKEKPFKCRNRDSDNRKHVSNYMLGHTVQLYISS